MLCSGFALFAGDGNSAAPRHTDKSSLVLLNVRFRDCDVFHLGSGRCRDLLDPDGIMSDFSGYDELRIPYANGQSGVQALVDWGGRFRIETKGFAGPGSTRTLFLDFGDPVRCPEEEPGDCAPPFISGLIEGDANLTVFDVECPGGTFLAIPIRSVVPAKMRLTFPHREPNTGRKMPWMVRFEGDGKAAEKGCGGKPSSKVLVRRTGRFKWEIEPEPDAAACLTRGLAQWRGQYRIPFQIRIAAIGKGGKGYSSSDREKARTVLRKK